MKPRLLLLTASFGEGHNAAARAIAAGCEELHGLGTAKIVDVFALTSPKLNSFLRRAYLDAINRTPRAWSAIYRWTDRSTILPRFIARESADLRRLAAIVDEVKPTAICSTFPAYGFTLERLKREGQNVPPHFTIVTDSISINSLWWRARSDGWFVPNEDTATVMREAGVDPASLHALGFPVAPFFHTHAETLSPPDLDAGGAPRVLFIINSGTHHAEEIAERLIAETGWEITCAVGRDEALRRRLQRKIEGRARPAQILGWTDQIPRLLLTHHMVISKAGGATTQEAVAARCPMVVNQVVPGQEEGNYELLRRHAAGVLAETPDAVIEALRRAFDSRGRVWKQLRAALTPLARPDAARDIAARVITRAEPAAALEPISSPPPQAEGVVASALAASRPA